MSISGRTKPFPVKELPEPLVEEIGRIVLDHSIALAAFRGDDPTTFRPLGSGTLVRYGEDFGILTAHHCLHAHKIPVTLGPEGQHSLAVCLTRGRTIVMAPQEAVEVPLAIPKVDEFGPDLSFIKITSADRLESIKCISSFWTIDETHRKRAESLVFSGAFTVSSGFPSADYTTFTQGTNIHHNITPQSFLGVVELSRILRKGDWDYFESQTDRLSSPKLPRSFAGVSGGGVWITSLREKADKSIFLS